MPRPVGAQLRLGRSNCQAKAHVHDFERSPPMGVPISLRMLLVEQAAKISPEGHREFVGLACIAEIQVPLRACSFSRKSFLLKFGSRHALENCETLSEVVPEFRQALRRLSPFLGYRQENRPDGIPDDVRQQDSKS
jgi:hypothetical protein